MNLNQITIPSNDVARSADFYQRLGLKMIVDSIPRYARFECPEGDATFSIHHTDETISGSGAWIYFELDDLDIFVDSLQHKGFHLETMPEDKNWMWREARLKDPDGHQLILFKAGINRKNPPWRLLD
ncbi:MAG: VOC family protein [Bacteroidetes bacterium]|nr:VOC family protein [Bacteroidota bacterium]